MTFNYKKCRFRQSSLKILGYVISADGINADPERLDDILKLFDPVDKTQLQLLLESITQLGKPSRN